MWDEAAAGRVGVAFAEALVRGDWAAAHALLAPSLRDDMQPADLQQEYGAMIGYWDCPVESVKLATVDAGWVYVAIYGTSKQFGVVQEGTYVSVIRERNRWLIDRIVWGRP